MKRIVLVSSLLAALVAFGSRPAAAAISADINIHVGERAPVVYFHQQPRGYLVPASKVYWYDNARYDSYRFGNMWYVNDGGYWYASRSWRGPFVGVRYASVPSPILRMPTRYRHQTRGYWQQAPQRQTWNNDRSRNDGDHGGWQSRDDDNNNGKGHGNGKNKNKGNGHGNS